jgi:hypothetical protein
MDDTRQRLREAVRRAPGADFDLTDVRARKDRRERRRRTGAGVLGVAITAGLVVGGLSMVGSTGDGTTVLDGGQGLPAVARPPRDLRPDEYSYQRIWIFDTCETSDLSPDAPCVDTRLHLESWWALDDSGRREILEAHGYGLDETGRFAQGAFPDEGDLSSFPTDPDALEAFLLDRSAPEGASPRPEVTPAPGVPVEEGLIWNAVQDYLGSTQYLNASPELRAAMLRVLAEQPMVNVHPGSSDPLERQATRLSFVAYGAATQVFVDPVTGDFLAMTSRYEVPTAQPAGDEVGDEGSIVTSVRLVEEAGFTATDDARPRGADRTVAPG